MDDVTVRQQQAVGREEEAGAGTALGSATGITTCLKVHHGRRRDARSARNSVGIRIEQVRVIGGCAGGRGGSHGRKLWAAAVDFKSAASGREALGLSAEC